MSPSDDDYACRPDVARPWDAGGGAELSVDEVTLPGAERAVATGLDGMEPSADEVTSQVLPSSDPRRRLDDNQVLRLADGIRAATEGFYQGDPRVLAFHLGIDAVPGFLEAGEPRTATEAVYSWHHDRRERGMRIYCALVHSFFTSRGIAYGPEDVWALAVELALPAGERWIGRMTLLFTQRFCPESVICAYVTTR